MGWLSELHCYYEHIEDYHERDLDKQKLVKDFLIFMKNKFGYEEDYFIKEYRQDSKEYIDVDDYIYKYHLRLDGNLRNEYAHLLVEAKKRIQEYKRRVHELNEKIRNEKEKYTRQKYSFF